MIGKGVEVEEKKKHVQLRDVIHCVFLSCYTVNLYNYKINFLKMIPGRNIYFLLFLFFLKNYTEFHQPNTYVLFTKKKINFFFKKTEINLQQDSVSPLKRTTTTTIENN